MKQVKIFRQLFHCRPVSLFINTVHITLTVLMKRINSPSVVLPVLPYHENFGSNLILNTFSYFFTSMKAVWNIIFFSKSILQVVGSDQVLNTRRKYVWNKIPILSPFWIIYSPSFDYTSYVYIEIGSESQSLPFNFLATITPPISFKSGFEKHVIFKQLLGKRVIPNKGLYVCLLEKERSELSFNNIIINCS